MSNSRTEPISIVSIDTHIGPRLVEDLRPFCPVSKLDAFDEFVQAAQADKERVKRFRDDDTSAEAIADREGRRNLRTAGHYDINARLADLNGDGVACEVIFHGSQNSEPIPFEAGAGIRLHETVPGDLGLAQLGKHIYNEWLAAAIQTEAHRHIGAVQIPAWDIEASVREIRWAHDAGLRAVNFPTMRAGILEFNRPEWEPFWSACEELEMPLLTHAGGASLHTTYSGPEAYALLSIEGAGWLARRALHWLILAGVFERHPRLKLVLIEQPGVWWTQTLQELDSVFSLNRSYLSHLTRLPSEYAMSNVLIGGSFLASFEAKDAIEAGYTSQVMWGSDYPHREGTFQHHPEGTDNRAKMALRFTFAEIPEPELRAMLGGNAIDLFGLDAAELQAVANRIGAPTPEELSRPLESIPTDGGTLAFRTQGTWA